ncbi:hypothetical protein KFE98_18315 [bacterium SCSIO 12741]|nr:hypothetical protein KFE98_18315 [bacterium SCSIO 12741]
MKRYWFLNGVKFLVLITLAVLAFTWVVMTLWNWLIPSIIGWSAISFWQAMGLLVLSKILFGGFHGKGGHWKHKRGQWMKKMKHRYEQMTPEEKEKFREKFKNRCGYNWSGFEPNQDENKPTTSPSEST